MERPATPNLDHEASHREEAASIGVFIEWLQINHGDMNIYDIRLPHMLYEYFGVDEKACERERVALLEWQRTLTA